MLESGSRSTSASTSRTWRPPGPSSTASTPSSWGAPDLLPPDPAEAAGLSSVGSGMRPAPPEVQDACQNGRVSGSEAALVVDEAEQDLGAVDGDLVVDEGVLGAGVDVAERPLEAAALA